MSMSYFVYIIQSQKDASFYIGYTSDIEQRIQKHNKATTGYSSRKAPWKLVYFEECEDKTAAIKRERFIKNQKSKEFILRLIADYQRY